jgi:nucleoside-diphosphate-sugar epimerase
MSRILLTGASGFVGRPALAQLLEAGHEVHAVSRRPAPPALAGLTWHQADLTDAPAAERLVREVAAEKLLHLAWYVEPGKYWQSVENVVWLEATLRLLRAFIAAGGRRAVLAGTCAEYEWSLDRYAEASAPLKPATTYGIAKNATRIVAERLAQDVGIELAWGRVFMPYGPGEPRERLLASVVAALLAGQRAPVSAGTQLRDFIYVDDVARAFVAMLDGSVCGAVNIGTGHGCSVAAMIELAAAAIGRAELVGWGELPPRDGEPDELLADVTRLHDDVGFTARIEPREGVERTIAWWREHAA